MNKQNSIVLLLVVTWIHCFSANSCSAQVVFESERFDGGELLQDEDRSYSLRLHNRGRNEVVFGPVAVDCSCLRMLDLPKSIGAGKTIALRLTIKTGMLKGPQKKTLRLLSEDKRVLSSVVVKFNVVPEFRLSPERLQLGPLVPGQIVERRVLIRGRPGAKPSLFLTNQTVPQVETRLISVDQESKERQWLAWVKISIPKTMKSGRFERRVPLVVKQGRVNELILHVYGDVERDLVIRPRIADFGQVFRHQEGSLKLTIESKSRRSFRIKNVLEDGVVFADFDDSLLAFRHQIVLQLPKGQTLGGKFGLIKFLTDHPETSVVDVRYRARVLEKKK